MDENKALAVLSPEQAEMIPAIIQQMIGPCGAAPESLIQPSAVSGVARNSEINLISDLVEAMGRMLENNTNALNQLASAQQIQADRLEALEKQIRLNTPVTRQQARYISAAMKEHALELLDKSSISDDKATRKLVSIIRKDILSDYGVTVLEEIPKHEYSVAMHRIKTWNNMRMVRDVIREVRKREEAAEMVLMESAEQTSGDYGSASAPGTND